MWFGRMKAKVEHADTILMVMEGPGPKTKTKNKQKTNPSSRFVALVLCNLHKEF